MSLKNILPVYPVFVNSAMTGVAVLTSPPSEIRHKDDIAYQMQWTGTPTGTFAVQVSLDYAPGTPTYPGAFNAGTWCTVPVKDSSGNPPVASGSAGLLYIGITQIEAPWIRIVYTNTAGVGNLNGYVAGKSVGL